METREIWIADTKTQQKFKIRSAATTLRELMMDMDANGIDYAGMSFTEGISKNQLLDPSSLLPTNVMYKGQPTNNLIILLTNTQKNIASGAATRQEAYAIIKKNGLQNAIKVAYGRNFTQVPTDKLWETINAKTEKSAAAVEAPAPKKEEKAVKEDPKDVAVEEVSNVAISFYDHIKTLAKAGAITASCVKGIAELTRELAARMQEEVTLSDEDVDSIIAGI